MKTSYRRVLAVIAAFVAGFGSLSASGAETPYRLLKEIPVGGDGGWDYLTVDAAGRRLYVSHATKVVASVPIGAGVDANAFDPATQLAFASCGGAGAVTIAKEETPDKLTVVQTLKTARGSRTMTLDPQTHRIYLAAVTYEEAPAAKVPDGKQPEAPKGRQGRPKAVPGSFKILVYGME